MLRGMPLLLLGAAIHGAVTHALKLVILNSKWHTCRASKAHVCHAPPQPPFPGLLQDEQMEAQLTTQTCF
jgi:hypothetical protein